jgi:hypothetical protein
MGDPYPGMHYLTDGKMKYIWFNDGIEQLFDLQNDPRECRNLSADPGYGSQLKTWRSRLIEKLCDRPEGFSDGERLIPNRDYPPHNALALIE